MNQQKSILSRSINSGLKNSNIETYSACNKEKSVIEKKIVRIIYNKIYAYMIAVSTLQN